MKFKINSKNLAFNGDYILTFLEQITEACRALDIDFFIIGAFARDLVLESINEVKGGRATGDIDFAINVSGWEEYNALKSKLIESFRFTQEFVEHRLTSEKGIPADIVPFGKIENGRHVSFPPDFVKEMNMIGFEEVFNHTIEIEIDERICVQVISLEGIVLLKLFAWNDIQPDAISEKHAEDILLIFKEYFEINAFNISEDFLDIFDDPEFDSEVAGARALGRRVSQICENSPELYQVLITLVTRISDEIDSSLLIIQFTSLLSTDFERARRIWNGFNKGVQEISIS